MAHFWRRGQLSADHADDGSALGRPRRQRVRSSPTAPTTGQLLADRVDNGSARRPSRQRRVSPWPTAKTTGPLVPDRANYNDLIDANRHELLTQHGDRIWANRDNSDGECRGDLSGGGSNNHGDGDGHLQ